MKILLSLLTIFTAFLFIPLNALAANPSPLQVSPVNNSVVSSTKLEWLVPQFPLKSTSPYRVQVHSSPDFISPLKDTTTSNTFYSPQLSEGIWYRRVLAKDSSNIESDWSQPSQFTYSTATPAPTPSPEPQIASTPTTTPIPTNPPTSSPSPTIYPSPTATPTPSPTFSISSLPSQIDSNQSIQNFVSLVLPGSPNTIFYLKGAFYEDGSSNYFGQTKYSGNWIKNSQTYSSQYKIQTDSQGKWQGFIEIIPDSQDTGFSSSGEYNFKVGRYTSSGSGPTWTDSGSLYINEIIIPSPSPSPSPSISPTPSTSTSFFSPTPKLDDPADLTEASLSAEEIEATQSTLDFDPQIATIEGVATTSGEIETTPSLTKGSKINPNWFYISSGLLFLAGLGSTFVVKYKPHLKIQKWLSKHNQPKTPKTLPSLWQNNLSPTAE